MSFELQLVAGLDNYCVFGNPIAHSKSPRIHTEFARQTGSHIFYSAVLVPEGAFPEYVHRFRDLGGKGASVTLPFKRQAWELCATRGQHAERAGAVNTIWFDAHGDMCGDNTDGTGLVRDITVNHGLAIHARRVLVLGAGGAARGVIPALLEAGASQLVIANRTAGKAVELADTFRSEGPVIGGGFDYLEGEHFDAIINATATSLQGSVPTLPDGLLRQGGWCYDLMYGQELTPFMSWGHAQGAQRCVDGLGMLVEQAAEAFFLWRGVRPDTAPVIRLLRAG